MAIMKWGDPLLKKNQFEKISHSIVIQNIPLNIYQKMRTKDSILPGAIWIPSFWRN